jgi:hypothetical protein
MQKLSQRNLFIIIQLILSIISLLLIFLHNYNIINIVSDMFAFIFFCFLDLFISILGLWNKIKIIKWNDIHIMAAIIIVSVSLFILFSTLFFTFAYRTALKLIFILICLKISIATVHNFKLF